MEYDNTNKGVLFINDKATDAKHPTRKGSLNVGGVEYWISAWDKNTSKGETISLSIQRKDVPEKFVSKAEERRVNTQRPSFDDDLPPWDR